MGNLSPSQNGRLRPELSSISDRRLYRPLRPGFSSRTLVINARRTRCCPLGRRVRVSSASWACDIFCRKSGINSRPNYNRLIITMVTSPSRWGWPTVGLQLVKMCNERLRPRSPLQDAIRTVQDFNNSVDSNVIELPLVISLTVVLG